MKGMIFLISAIVPTLGTRKLEIKRLFDSLDNQTYKDFEVIIVSQDNHSIVDDYLREVNFTYNHIKINKKGLSIARNEALKYVNGDIITFSDDDCWYIEDSFEFVNKYFNENKSDICSFQHYDPHMLAYPKDYPICPNKNISKRKILSQASIDIFVNTRNVVDYKIGFDERFGVGSKYSSGEENIYLMDLYNRGYKIEYYPKVISYHPNKINKHNMKLDVKMVIDKAPLFKRLFGRYLGIIIYFIFIFRKCRNIDYKHRCIFYGLQEYFRF